MDRCGAPLAGQLRELARVALDQQGLTGARLRWMANGLLADGYLRYLAAL